MGGWRVSCFVFGVLLGSVYKSIRFRKFSEIVNAFQDGCGGVLSGVKFEVWLLVIWSLR